MPPKAKPVDHSDSEIDHDHDHNYVLIDDKSENQEEDDDTVLVDEADAEDDDIVYETRFPHEGTFSDSYLLLKDKKETLTEEEIQENKRNEYVVINITQEYLKDFLNNPSHLLTLDKDIFETETNNNLIDDRVNDNDQYVSVTHADAPQLDSNYGYPSQLAESRNKYALQLLIQKGKEPLLILISTATAIPLAAYALGAFLNTTPDKFNKATFTENNSGLVTLSVANGLASGFVNALLAYRTIPDAIEMAHERLWRRFMNNPIKNLLLAFIAGGAGLAAGGMGYASLITLGQGEAYTNLVFSMFTFFITRYFGLINAHNRFGKWHSHRFEPGVFTGNSFEDVLSRLPGPQKRELNEYLESLNDLPLREELVTKLLKKLGRMLLTQTFNLTAYSTSELAAFGADILLPALGALAIIPGFSKKFDDGVEKLYALFSGASSDEQNAIKNLPNSLKIPLSILMSIANPVLYVGQIKLIREKILDAYAAVTDPTLTKAERAKKIGLAILLIVSNILACSSLYGLTMGVSKEDGNFVLPGPIGTMINAVLAAAAALGVNAKLTIEKALPRPEKEAPTLSHVPSASTFTLPSPESRRTTTPPLATLLENSDEAKAADIPFNLDKSLDELNSLYLQRDLIIQARADNITSTFNDTMKQMSDGLLLNSTEETIKKTFTNSRTQSDRMFDTMAQFQRKLPLANPNLSSLDERTYNIILEKIDALESKIKTNCNGAIPAKSKKYKTHTVDDVIRWLKSPKHRLSPLSLKEIHESYRATKKAVQKASKENAGLKVTGRGSLYDAPIPRVATQLPADASFNNTLGLTPAVSFSGPTTK